MTAALQKIDWCHDAEVALQSVKLPRGHALDFFRLGIERGEKELFAVLLNDVVQGYVVAWIDGRDLVLGLAAQSIRGQSRAALFLRLFEALAVKYDCGFVRGHTIRGGMLKVAADEGYTVEEIIYRKSVGGKYGV